MSLRCLPFYVRCSVFNVFSFSVLCFPYQISHNCWHLLIRISLSIVYPTIPASAFIFAFACTIPLILVTICSHIRRCSYSLVSIASHTLFYATYFLKSRGRGNPWIACDACKYTSSASVVAIALGGRVRPSNEPAPDGIRLHFKESPCGGNGV